MSGNDGIVSVAGCGPRVHVEVDWWWMSRFLEETSGSIDRFDPSLVSFISSRLGWNPTSSSERSNSELKLSTMNVPIAFVMILANPVLHNL